MSYKSHACSVAIVCGLVGLFAAYYLSNQFVEILRGGNFNIPSCWHTHVYYPPSGTSVIRDGKAYLEINDTEGLWYYSRIQQGILPHNWGAATTDTEPLDQEIVFREYIEARPNCYLLNIALNQSHIFLYNTTESHVNGQITLWLDCGQGYTESVHNSTVLDISIRFTTDAYYNGTLSFEEREWARLGENLSETDPRWNQDYHIICSAPVLLGNTTDPFVIRIDLGSYVEKAFSLLKRDINVDLSSAKLKDVDIIIEADYGYGAETIDYVSLKSAPTISSAYVLYWSFAYAMATCAFLLVLISILQYLKTKRWKKTCEQRRKR